MSNLDPRDKKLRKWLAGTNWPKGYTYEHKLVPISNGMAFANKVSIIKGLNRVEYYMNSKVLTRSDFDHIVEKSIDIIEKDYKLLQETSLTQTVERTEEDMKTLKDTWDKL